MSTHPPPRVRRRAARALVLVLGAAVGGAALPWKAGAQLQAVHEEAYLAPPSEIARVLDAPRHEQRLLTDLGPTGEVFLNALGAGMPALEAFARPYHRLAGLEVDPRADRLRNLTIRSDEGLELVAAEDGRRIPVRIPDGGRVSGATWSPEGARVAFLVHGPEESHLHVADAADGEARRVTERPLLATRVTEPAWSGDGGHVFAVVVPDGRGGAPAPAAVPASPMVRVTSPGENRLRTYPSLLRDGDEARLLEHHTTGQLVRIDVGEGRARPIGSPAMIESIDVAPDGRHVRVRTTAKPFSYIVPVSQFGDVDEVWDLDGRRLVELERREPREGIQDDDDEEEEPGRRQLRWRPDGQGLSFLQREAGDAEADEAGDDEGEGARRAARKDRVMQWLPPFGEDDLHVVYEHEREIRSLEYGPDARWLFFTERQGDTERLRAVHLDDPEALHTVYEWDTEDFHANPGTLMTRPGARGGEVVRLRSDGEHVFLSGTRFAEDPDVEAPRPFVDRVEIATGAKERIFESDPDVFERVAAVLDDDLERIVLTRESPSTVPDSWLLDRQSGEMRRLTRNEDPHPELTALGRERLTVTRPDGVRFKVDVTFPPGAPGGERLPALFWHYPREYEDQEAYDRSTRTYNRNRFPAVGPRSMEILALRGYVVVQPDHPTIGPEGRINDRFIPDLRANHLVVIDALAERGWIDRRRLALGGHSYGGFGTINAMVHTPYFRAGIAGAPNSNRLLTPIGFQTERRPLWESRETYLEMSPFLWAERLSGALLIYHGDDDQNVGTFPDNSWRLIHALNGLGKTAALYMYPYEGHGPATRETLHDMWARWIAWLDHYVMHADPTEPVAPVAPVVEEDGGVEGR